MKAKKKFDDSVNDKAEPKIDHQSQIETGGMMSGGCGKVRGNHEEIEDIADHHRNQ